MATEKWVTVGTRYCEILQAEAEMMELRRYPAEVVPDMLGYQVVAQRCSAAVECNLIGGSCEHAFTNPSVDRFHLDRK